MDNELSDTGFMVALQQVGVLKAIVSSWCLSNYRDLFNLCHLVCLWCYATHTFFISYGEITMTLEDVANQLLLPTLSVVDSSDIKFSAEGEAMEAELRKGMNGNTKLSHWVGPFSKASNAPPRALCRILALEVHLWLSLTLCRETFLLSISHKDFCWGESAVGPYVSGSSVCAVGYSTK